MLTYLLVALGGAIGSIARLWLSVQVGLLTGLKFPWGTIVVNIVSSLVIGFFSTLTGPNGRVAAPIEAQAFVMIGPCGGFTTFSAFSLQTLELLQSGDIWPAGGYIAGSLVLCLAAVWAGWLVGRL